MKKVLSSASKFIFGGFGIAVLALLMSLTYGALQKLFPGNFGNQMWGLVMFDIAAMCWAVAFVFQSRSTGQYAAAGIGFLVGFTGTLGMVAAEVMLSGQELAPVQTEQIGRWMVYGFIIVTALHAALVYAHHALAPDIAEQINVGVARGEIVTEAISQATRELEQQKALLAQTIHQDIVSQVKRDLGLYPIQDTVFDRRDRAEPERRQQYELAAPPVARVAEKPKPRSLWEAFKQGIRQAQKDATGTAKHPNPLIRAPLEQTQSVSRPTKPEMQFEVSANDRQGWFVTNIGTRTRMWCLDCRDQGDIGGFVSPAPCGHVMAAQPVRTVGWDEHVALLNKFVEEANRQEDEPSYHPVPLESRPLNEMPDYGGQPTRGLYESNGRSESEEAQGDAPDPFPGTNSG